MTAVRSDVYSRVTEQIVAELEAGVRPWVQPWNAAHAAGEVSRPLRYNAVPYRGINVVLLWMSALRKRFTNPLWMTYKQAAELGGQVRKGVKGSPVVYADRFSRREIGDDGQEQEVKVPFLKSYTVFNAEQIDGLPAHYYAKAEQPTRPVERIERAERFAAHTGADIRYGGGMAYYSPAGDFVQMPERASFRRAEALYATLQHELVHWTRAKTRLDREFGQRRWGDEGYAMEELVAELGAAFLCADLGLTLEIRDDHAAYIGCWIKVLKNDKRAVFTAAGHAQRAADRGGRSGNPRPRRGNGGMTMLYRVYNQGEIPALAPGWRSIIALTPGRKWVTVIDWTTLETARLEIKQWQKLKPQPDDGLNRRKVRAAMRRRLNYVTPTEAIREALRLLRETAA